jgi:hypothetical protein
MQNPPRQEYDTDAEKGSLRAIYSNRKVGLNQATIDFLGQNACQSQAVDYVADPTTLGFLVPDDRPTLLGKVRSHLALFRLAIE